MYRVELKVSYSPPGGGIRVGVPNVPCGVESNLPEELIFVPQEFLMYRVELKEQSCHHLCRGGVPVPNVPCGVESSTHCHGTTYTDTARS